MRKVITLMLGLILIVSLAGCKNGNSKEDNKTGSQQLAPSSNSDGDGSGSR